MERAFNPISIITFVEHADLFTIIKNKNDLKTADDRNF